MEQKPDKVKVLDKLRENAKKAILMRLHRGSCNGKDLEQEVFQVIKSRKGVTSLHTLAFIEAYKELEKACQIHIVRPRSVPYPMTDWETKFELTQTLAVKDPPTCATCGEPFGK